MTAKQTTYQAAKEIANPFTLEQLLLAAWTKDREAFGLDGYKALHPDMRRLVNVLYGIRGMIVQGSILKDGKKYRVGKPLSPDHATRGGNGKYARPAEENGHALSLHDQERLARARQSRAFRLFGEGKRDAVDARDALSFWGSNLAEKVEAFGELLRSQETPEMRVLLNIHDHLIGRFGKFLKRKENV